MSNRFGGFSLIELLLVLVCIAAILSWPMHHYKQRQRRAQAMQIESDVKSWQRTLDSYFHTTGCDQSGVFTVSGGDNINVDCQTLQQINADIICGRSPLVERYVATIIKTDQTTKDTPAKPIYQLRVQAVMLNLTPEQLTWYQQELRAKPGAQSSTLTWDSLPANTTVQLGDKSWVLNGAGTFFRATENRRAANDTTLPQSSGSFCAH